MKVLIVYAHPEPRSFNGALLARARAHFAKRGWETRVSDLYAMKFDPVARAGDFTDFEPGIRLDYYAEQKRAQAAGTLSDDIKAEIDKIAWCDLMILQFPLYWFSMPAIMKGWVDRVFVPGFAYGGGAWYERGGLTGKRAMVVTTMAAFPQMMAANGINGIVDVNLWPIQNGILAFCGFDVMQPFLANAVPYIDADARTAMLGAYEARLETIDRDAPMAFHRREEFGRDWSMKDDVVPRTVGHYFAGISEDVISKLKS